MCDWNVSVQSVTYVHDVHHQEHAADTIHYIQFCMKSQVLLVVPVIMCHYRLAAVQCVVINPHLYGL